MFLRADSHQYLPFPPRNSFHRLPECSLHCGLSRTHPPATSTKRPKNPPTCARATPRGPLKSPRRRALARPSCAAGVSSRTCAGLPCFRPPADRWSAWPTANNRWPGSTSGSYSADYWICGPPRTAGGCLIPVWNFSKYWRPFYGGVPRRHRASSVPRRDSGSPDPALRFFRGAAVVGRRFGCFWWARLGCGRFSPPTPRNSAQQIPPKLNLRPGSEFRHAESGRAFNFLEKFHSYFIIIEIV